MRYVPLYLAGLTVAALGMVVGATLAGVVIELLPTHLDVTAKVVAVVLLVGVPLFAAALVGRAAPASDTRPPAAPGARAHLARSWPFYGVAVAMVAWIGGNAPDGVFLVLGPWVLVPCLAAVGLVLGDLWWSRTARRLAR